jgi:hypothetical protein
MVRIVVGNFRKDGSVSNHWYHGFINTKGKQVIEPKYWDLGQFCEGLACARLDSTTEFGYLKPDGNWGIPPAFRGASDFSDGLAAVLCSVRLFTNDGRSYLDRHWGFINKTGKTVIKPQFYKVYPFNGGLACVVKKENGQEKYGVIDKKGNFIIPPKYQFVGSRFINGITSAKIDNKWGLLDKTGKWSRIDDCTGLGGFSKCGLAPARETSGMQGYIDTDGNWVIKPTYLLACTFDNGWGRVRVSSRKWIYINPQGKQISKFKSNVPLITGPFYSGRAPVETWTGSTDIVTGKKTKGGAGVIDTKGNWIVLPEYDYVIVSPNGYSHAQLINYDSKVFDRNGKVIWTFSYRNPSRKDDN